MDGQVAGWIDVRWKEAWVDGCVSRKERCMDGTEIGVGGQMNGKWMDGRGGWMVWWMNGWVNW